MELKPAAPRVTADSARFMSALNSLGSEIMLRNVRLKLLPTVFDCLSWSPDGALAVVAGEDVVILVPKFVSTDGSKKRQQFWHTRANTRQLIVKSMDDVIEPAESQLYSIGEEQGPGFAKEICWSPLGASRYRRCLLAILSMNHKIYIYEPVGHVADDLRPLHDLTELMKSYHGLPAGDNKTVDRTTRSRLRSRSRSMAWGPPCRTEGNRWGESLLAVANEYLEIVLFRVSFDKTEIVGHVTPFPEELVAKYLGNLATHVTSLRWGPWMLGANGKHWVLLAFAWGGKTMVQKISLDGSDHAPAKFEAVGEAIVVGSTVSVKHPIFSVVFAPEDIGGRIVLAFSAQNCTTVVTFDGVDGRVLSMEPFKNDFIELVTGVAFAPSEIPNTTIVQLLTALGKSQIITYTVPDTPMAASKTVSTVYSSGDTYMPEAPTDEELRTIGSSWPAIVAEMKQDYMSEHDIPNALVRGYGLTVSPFGGITAIAVSFHPKDSLEYITASNEKSTIVFGTPHGSSGCWKSYGLGQGTLPNPITATTEALLIESVALGSVFTSRVHNAIAATDDEPELRDIVFEEGQDVKEYLAKHTLMSPPLNALQYSAALNLVENPEKASSRLLVENPHIVGASIVAALTAPRSLCGDEDSKRILYSFACVGIMGLYTSSTVLALAKEAFEWLDANTPTETSFELEQRIIAMRTRTGNSGDESENLNVDNGFVSSMEKCGVCKEGMVWRDLRIAECTNKHRLSRCALTFLPITAPKDTRECSVCARTVLGGYVGEVRPPEGSLVEAVFGGWEACLQCGGRYWAERG